MLTRELGRGLEPATKATQIVVEVTTASDSAGAGVPWLLVLPDPEQPGNNTAMVAG
jgi:hypothetical protein